jgi:hypothetical protein
MEKLILTKTGTKDAWSRPIYVDKAGNIYKDIAMNDNDPKIFTCSKKGEPDCPVKEYELVG